MHPQSGFRKATRSMLHCFPTFGEERQSIWVASPSAFPVDLNDCSLRFVDSA